MLGCVSHIPEVQDWQWDLAVRMREGIEQVYASRPDEVECVRAMVNAIDGAKPVTVNLDKRASFNLIAEAAFLHGSQSQVQFRVGSEEYSRELADLLVLATYVEDGGLKFQRACFIQTKRSRQSEKHAAFRYSIDPWQLALLSSFPEFRGLSGVFADLEVRLWNRSGMLGAYGLLSPPGEIVIVSAIVLNQVLGGRKSFTAKELVPAILSESAASRGSVHLPCECCWFDPQQCPYCHELLAYLLRHYGTFPRSVLSAAVGNSEASVTTCMGLDEFVRCWTGLRLGEVWRADSVTLSERVLRGTLHAAVRRVSSATGKLAEVRKLLDSVSGNDNLRFDGENPQAHDGGLGVLSVVVSREGWAHQTA